MLQTNTMKRPFAYSLLTSRDKVESVGYSFENYQEIKAKTTYNPINQLSNLMSMGGTSESWCTRDVSTGVVFSDSDQKKDDS